MKLWNVPIESLEERYSKQWNENFPKDFNKRMMEWENVYPQADYDNKEISIGQFLDVVDTHKFKAKQISHICDHFKHGDIKDGDVFFFHDLWFPGIEALFYIRDALKIRFKITGMLHAGTYDPHDYLTQCGMARWGKKLEESIFNEIDLIFVATGFHKQLLISKRTIKETNKIRVTGFPLWDRTSSWASSEKENIIVFPHRLAPEKGPYEFDKLAVEFEHNQLQGWKFYRTKDIAKTKGDYYNLLRRSKIALSFAKQETWGIAQQEAMFRGCIPLVPNRLSYKEMYDKTFIYKSNTELKKKLLLFAKNYFSIVASDVFKDNVQSLKRSNNAAVDNMIHTIRTTLLIPNPS